MPENNNTQQSNVGANPDNGANQTLDANQGHPEMKPQTNEGKSYSQQDLDNTAAKARGTAERETRRKLLAQLGLKDDEEDKLLKFKEAYENSLTDEEKRNTEMENLRANNLKLSQDIEEKEYIIKALITMTGKKEEDVDKIVKMAKGLKTESNTIEDAINEVLSMIGNQVTHTEKTNENNIPTGQPLTQPSTTIEVNTQVNPFKPEHFNLTEQGKLMRLNPELAKKLAAEAGVKLPNI